MEIPVNAFKRALARNQQQIGLWCTLSNPYLLELLAGSFTRPVNVAAGDVVHADFGPLGSIGVSFS